jgi:transposase
MVIARERGMQDNRCLDYRRAITESTKRLYALEREQTKALLRDRMRFLRLLKSGECPSQAQAGKAIGLGLRGAEKLWKKYTREGLEGLLHYPYQGRKEKLDAAQKQALEAELAKDQSQSLSQVCQYVEKQSGVHYTIPGMHYVLERLKVKKKTGRPVYHNKDIKGEKQFKKKSFRR